MHFLEKELDELLAYVPYSDKVNDKVSHASVGRHIDHSLLAVKEIMQQCLTADPAAYRWSWNTVRYIVLWTGFIPRGGAKAPDFTLPKNDLSEAEIQLHADEVRSLLVPFLALTDNHKNCVHPFFGMLTLAESKRNCVVHTRHHLKIIRDIVRG